MSLFDYYQPSVAFACPVCGAVLDEWQSYDGPCGLFLFREGVAGAVEQCVDPECRIAASELMALLLPEEFFIRSHDCGCPFPSELRCCSEGGTWVRTEMYTGSEMDLRLRGAERREHWQARRKWLKE